MTPGLDGCVRRSDGTVIAKRPGVNHLSEKGGVNKREEERVYFISGAPRNTGSRWGEKSMSCRVEDQEWACAD